MIYNAGNLVTGSLQTNYGFTVSATVATTENGNVVSQGNSYALAVNEAGYATFTVNGATAVSDVLVNDGEEHTIIGVKENNGILKQKHLILVKFVKMSQPVLKLQQLQLKYMPMLLKQLMKKAQMYFSHLRVCK